MSCRWCTGTTSACERGTNIFFLPTVESTRRKYCGARDPMATNPGNGIQSAIFGPPAWMFLHCVAANYPLRVTEEVRRTHAGFLEHVGKVLPCRYCRDNFQENLRAALCASAPETWKQQECKDMRLQGCALRRRPLHDWPQFDGRESFFKLVWQLHEEVSKCVKGDRYRPTNLDDVRARYETYRADCHARSAGASDGQCTGRRSKGACEVHVNFGSR